jgi:hypothetical protein
MVPNRGYPLKAGHHMTSTSERHGLVSFPRPWHIIDFRYHGFQEIRKRPPEKTRRWRRPICSATIEGLQGCPALVSLRGPSTMMVRPVRERTVATFDGRGGALQGLHPLGRPHVPLFTHLGGHPPGDRVLGHRATDRLQEPEPLGLPACATRLGGLVGPRDKRQEPLPGPAPAQGRQVEWLHSLPHPCPPKSHQGRAGRDLLADLRQGIVPVRHLRAFRPGCDGLPGRGPAAGDLRGRLGSRVRPPTRMPRARARLQVVSRPPLPLCPSAPRGPSARFACPSAWTARRSGAPCASAGWLARTASAGVRAWGAGLNCRAIASEERCPMAGRPCKQSGRLRHAQPCSARCMSALARALTQDSTRVPRACSRSSTTACPVA